MQNQENCYENVWILSGTSDGPILANKFLAANYVVFASVITHKAGESYKNNPSKRIRLSHSYSKGGNVLTNSTYCLLIFGYLSVFENISLLTILSKYII